MVSADLLQKLLLILPLAYQNEEAIKAEGDSSPPWNYDDTTEWGSIGYPLCDGDRQSPIHLRTRTAMLTSVPPLSFINYRVPLGKPLTLRNNGHTAQMDIPPTKNGGRAALVTSRPTNRYNAANVHFHWGSSGVKGSEHIVNGRAFDVEMHIVHQNAKYASQEEALQNRDGIAVLGIFFKMVQNPTQQYPGLNMIFNRLPRILRNGNQTNLTGPLAMGQLLGDVNTKHFFVYNGSLTTPPCAEAVTFYVYPEPLQIASAQIRKFWNLFDTRDQPLINNFRPIQDTNGRPVYYRRTSGSTVTKSINSVPAAAA